MEFYYCLLIIILPRTLNLIRQNNPLEIVTFRWPTHYKAGFPETTRHNQRRKYAIDNEFGIFQANNSEIQFITNTY
jgi:hypothetical protein